MPEHAEDTLSTDGSENSRGKGQKPEVPVEELEARDLKIEELTETLKRTQAEFENYKKRVAREWADRVNLAGERIMTDLLAVLDTLDKAEQAASSGEAESDDEEGIRSIHRQLLQTLHRAGLREVDTGVRFDPFMHEALMREEREEGDEGEILEVCQKGYMLGAKVVRTAKVKVATKKQADEDSTEETEAVGKDDDQ